MNGSPQNSPQLGQEHGGVGQTPANGPQPQRRVEVSLVLERLVQRLVGPDVHRANGHGQALHALYGTPVGVVLLFFIGQLAVAAHEQKLAAKQAHTHSARLNGAWRVVRHLNIGQQLNALAIERDRRRVPQAAQAPALEFALALLEPILRQNNR